MIPSLYATLRAGLLFVQTMAAVWIFGRKHPRRLPGPLSAVVVLLAALLCNQVAAVLYDPQQTGSFLLSRTLCMVFLYCMVIAVTFLLYDVSWPSALITACAGYAAQNAAGSLKGILRLIPWGGGFWNSIPYEVLIDLLCYGSCYLCFFFVFRKAVRAEREERDSALKAAFSVVVLLLCVGMSRITLDLPHRAVLNIVADNLYAIISSVLLLMVQFGTLDNRSLTRDVDTMRELIHTQRAQFETSRECSHIIEEKYHDLKKMIATLGSGLPAWELDRLEESISDYGALIRTGNEVLDILLTEKRMVCSRASIQISCMTGGVDLRFVDELDQYALFNNALTNAIEAVQQLPEQQPRYLTVSLREEGSLVFFHMENPCAAPVQYADGLPQTTGDKDYHGFGMKSMAHTAEKYGGALCTDQRDGMFYLDVTLLRPI